MIKWFSPIKYYDPADYEAWFENLAEQGYHPRITPFSFIAMRFKKGEPKKYKYVVDLQAVPKKEYTQTYEGFGWEKAGKMANMFVWRKEYTEDKPQAFSDAENVGKRNARVARAMTFSTVMAFIAAILCWTGFALTLSEGSLSVTAALGALGGAAGIAGSLLLALSIRILRSKKGFKNKPSNTNDGTDMGSTTDIK